MTINTFSYNCNTFNFKIFITLKKEFNEQALQFDNNYCIPCDSAPCYFPPSTLVNEFALS